VHGVLEEELNTKGGVGVQPSTSPAALVRVHLIGWSPLEIKVTLGFWVAVFLAFVAWAFLTDWQGPRVMESEAAMDVIVYALGGLSALPFAAVYFLGRNRVRRPPLVVVGQSGVITRGRRVIPWERVVGFQLSSDGANRDAYFELRDPRNELKDLERFVFLCKDSVRTRFWIIQPGLKDAAVSDKDLVYRLQQLQLKFAPAKVAAAPASGPAQAPTDLRIPQTLPGRIAMVIFAAAGTAGGAGLGWLVSRGFFSDDFHNPVGWVLLGVGAWVTVEILVTGSRLLVAGLAGTPALLADRTGLRDMLFGRIPWTETTGLWIEEFGDEYPKSPALCVYLTKAFYSRRLRGKLLQWLYLTLTNTGLTFKRTPRLPLIRGLHTLSRRGYEVDGRAMPPALFHDLAGHVSRLKPAGVAASERATLEDRDTQARLEGKLAEFAASAWVRWGARIVFGILSGIGGSLLFVDSVESEAALMGIAAICALGGALLGPLLLELILGVF
jgi:branched-subunit amino acid transport protein